jgi:ribonuclease P protein component
MVARLKARADFLAAAKGRRQHQRCFVLQARQRPAPDDSTGPVRLADQDTPRFGFTVTKKVGNSVIRNRIRRRLREAVRLADGAAPESRPRPRHDYVLIARIEALTAPFDELRGELVRALAKIHQTKTHQSNTHPAGAERRPPAAPAADHKQDL